MYDGGVDVQIDDAAARGVTGCHCRRGAEAAGSASGCVVAKEEEQSTIRMTKCGEQRCVFLAYYSLA
jgi:hypothetical protein